MVRVDAEGKAGFTDYEPYSPSNGEPSAFLAQNIYERNGKNHGMVAVQLSIDNINAIMHERAGMGESGESYLVGSDLIMRSDSKFDGGSSILKKKVDTAGTKESLKKNRSIEAKAL